ncbi:TetR family transcriptional regulator [Metarhizobium album]|uniref:TetR family transcriptional regulator n=1 Tax=Metarhizobium album TaxID=2182425 RepID=A0A2U2DUK8_9HYPH|nr:TetR/AcrR family transcriptional regulator [Rhizobium album]OJT96167.1 MAG: TetR family transcriptional regulator [Rhizobium sp. 63-7]PWE57003.1 TetR family transcriptional regulator [Rhizobium album]
MSESHRRKKQPQLVRRQLVDVAAQLAFERGIGAVTLDAVSEAAGVSKGGLLHHFPGKVALLDGLFDRLVDELDAAIEAAMIVDPLPHGRFTRAYLQVVADLKEKPGENRQWAGLTMALLNEPHLRARWRQWVDRRAGEYVGTDSSLNAAIVRFAADGLWLADMVGSHDLSAETRSALIERLSALTLS